MRIRSIIQRRQVEIILFLVLFCIHGSNLKAQLTRRVLFLGNSYTYFNNLPQLLADAALSVGDTLVFDSNAIGGYQLEDHAADATSQNKIMTGGWDYVVIQGQSQEPVVYTSQFNNGGASLFALIKQHNPCAVTMPYMTWGRKNGDAASCSSFPVMCTYQGMDTTIRDRYLDLTEFINGEVSPVSVVWRYIRQNHPGIELYQPDQSHPSLAGSYAAACCFYAMIFKKDPTLITYNAGLSASDAADIRNAAKIQVFDTLSLWDFKRLPVSNFAFQIGAGVNEVIFNPLPQGTQQTYSWDFGDGTTSSSAYTSHSYAANGTYTVTLTTTNCDLQGVHTSVSDTVIQFCNHTPSVFTNHGGLCNYDTLWTGAADTYQWYANGVLIPETNQYIADYAQYAATGFSVMSSVNGCSELSEAFTDTPQWSGYYFDGMGNPCNGDTVVFAVLHMSGSLSGSAFIQWFKNDTLLPAMTNEDTLLITGPGKYECKVIDSNSSCPSDTTSSVLFYECGTTGFNENTAQLSMIVFPNPASETVTVRFKKFTGGQVIEVLNAMGLLMKAISITDQSMEIDIGDLPSGLYFIRERNAQSYPVKLIKE